MDQRTHQYTIHAPDHPPIRVIDGAVPHRAHTFVTVLTAVRHMGQIVRIAEDDPSWGTVTWFGRVVGTAVDQTYPDGTPRPDYLLLDVECDHPVSDGHTEIDRVVIPFANIVDFAAVHIPDRDAEADVDDDYDDGCGSEPDDDPLAKPDAHTRNGHVDSLRDPWVD